MKKRNIFIGLIATFVLIAGFSINKTFAAQDSNNNVNNNWGMGMMRNFNSQDFQKMSEAHNLMAQGKIDEARNVMQELGMGNCPMMGDHNGNVGGMMGGNGRGMMGNFQ